MSNHSFKVDGSAPLKTSVGTQGQGMRYLAIPVITLFFVTCSAASIARSPSKAQAAAKAPPVDFLLTKAATDFHNQHPSDPIHFHDVRLGHVSSSDGAVRHILCGEFERARENGKGERTFFVTIDTAGGPHGYDLQLGGQVASLCREASLVWDNEGDLSAALQRTFDARE